MLDTIMGVIVILCIVSITVSIFISIRRNAPIEQSLQEEVPLGENQISNSTENSGIQADASPTNDVSATTTV
jgi:hypothetical protein